MGSGRGRFLPGGDDARSARRRRRRRPPARHGDVSDVAAGRVRRFIPFSVGPRQCVGQSLARLMHDGGIAHLYGRFSFALAPRMGGWDGVEAAEINRLTLQPLAGLWMRATPRAGVKAGGGGCRRRAKSERGTPLPARTLDTLPHPPTRRGDAPPSARRGTHGRPFHPPPHFCRQGRRGLRLAFSPTLRFCRANPFARV